MLPYGCNWPAIINEILFFQKKKKKQGEAEANDSDSGTAIIPAHNSPSVVPLSNGDNKALVAEI